MTHSIIPPPKELVVKWLCEFFECDPPLPVSGSECLLVARAAQYGADQELEACCKWLEKNVGRWEIPLELRDARRPQPPSLKEQAKQALSRFDANAHTAASEMIADFAVIRRALEALPDD